MHHGPRHGGLLSLMLLLSLYGDQTYGQTASISNGKIEGIKCASTAANSFLGIPYAKAPIGDLRFASPQAYDAKYDGGVLQARSQPASCIQFGAAFIEAGQTSEDCLFLNVYSPANVSSSSSSKLPVKVWIYGGSNEAGGIADPAYDGCFSATNSIVVTLNYRVGPLGWLALPGAGISGNFGTQDQLLALQWVHDNIASFGGDPSRVLVFGQSAGAAATWILSTLPQGPKLFSAAAMESGGGRTLPTVAEARAWNHAFVTALNCSATDGACIRGLSAAAMNKTELGFLKSGPGVSPAGTLLDNKGKGPTWGPVVDGSIIPTQPLAVGIKVPGIFGSTSREGTLFEAILGKRIFTVNQTDYNAFLVNSFGSLASKVNDTYSLSKFPKAPDGTRAPTPAFYAMSTIITLYDYVCTARRGMASGVKNRVSVYGYNFTHSPSCAWSRDIPPGNDSLALLGATHTSEIPFVFGLTKNLPPGGGNCSFTTAETDISATLVSAWDSMAASGKPASDQAWPAWTSTDSYAGNGLVVGAAATTGALNYQPCEFWDEIDKEISRMDDGGNSTGSDTAPPHSGSAKRYPLAGFVGWILIGSVLAPLY